MIEKILKAIERRGIDQKDLAECIHVPRNRISKWKGGQGEPTARQIYDIAKALEIPVLYFLDDAIAEPEDVPFTSEDERLILRVFRAAKISADTVAEAIVSLARSGPPVPTQSATRHAQLDAILSAKDAS